MTRPAASTRGPLTSPLSTARDNSIATLPAAPQSRTVVTPDCRVSCRLRNPRRAAVVGLSARACAKRSGDPSWHRCTWQLMSPGSSDRPSPSTTLSRSPWASSLAGPIQLIRVPSTITAWPGTARPPRPSTRLTSRIANADDGSAMRSSWTGGWRTTQQVYQVGADLAGPRVRPPAGVAVDRRRRGLGVRGQDHRVPAQLVEVFRQVCGGPLRLGRGEYPRSDEVAAAHGVAPAWPAAVAEEAPEFFQVRLAEVGGEGPPVEPPGRAGQREQGEVRPLQHTARQLRGDRGSDDRALAVTGQQDWPAIHREPVLVSQFPLARQGLAGCVRAYEQPDPVNDLGYRALAVARRGERVHRPRPERGHVPERADGLALCWVRIGRAQQA